jgi:Holliday junction DNA helicase RuvA
MIGLLTGKIEYIDNDSRDLIVLTSSGVGYLVRSNIACSIGDEVKLYVYTSVSENNIGLWGFVTSLELKLFKLLIGVSGIGPTSGANIIYSLGAGEFVRLLTNGGLEKVKVPGVGLKSIQKIVIELKNKVADNAFIMQQLAADSVVTKPDNGYLEEAIMGLVALGYDNAIVRAYFAKIDTQDDTQALIKKFLSDNR